MNKILAIIALGAATAQAGYVYQYAPMTGDNSNDYFNFEMVVNADAKYSTTYIGGTDDSQARGLQISTVGQVTFVFEFFNWYKHAITFQAQPLVIAPYTESLSYVRPLSEVEDDDTSDHAAHATI
jgi:hypothetical protein